MATIHLVKMLCVKCEISMAELARRCGSSPQAFSQKLRRDGFTPSELKKIAEAVNCKYENAFVLPDGSKIND